MKIKAIAAATALGFSLFTVPASAVNPTPTIAGYPKCVTTKAGAAKYGWAKTKKGEICAAKMVGKKVGKNRTDYSRTQPLTENWELLAVVWDDDSGDIIANLVRRPR